MLPGPPAPWLSEVERHQPTPVSIERVRDVMSAIGPSQAVPDPVYAPGAGDPILPEPIPGRPSAVLIPLYPAPAGPDGSHEAHVLLTRRSSRLRSHTGQVSFPGGRIDPDEPPVAAALREAAEEVGLDPTSIEILGQLSPLSTISSGSFITPFVGVLPGRPVMRPNPAEVELAFDVALSELASPHVYRAEFWVTADGAERPMHFFALDEDLVWGATARILHQLLQLIYTAPA